MIGKETSKKFHAAFVVIPVFILFMNYTATAQKAPPFSNDIMMDNQTYVFFMVDRLEYNITKGLHPLVWDAQGYVGKDFNKFWFETKGEMQTAQREGEMEFQGLYSHAITTYFDLQAGLRYDVAYADNTNRSRGFAAIGLQGLAPYLFEIDANLNVSQDGDISADFEAEYDFPISQRLWGQPRLGTSIAVQEVTEWGVGSGLNDVQLGFRLRYEIRREFAPYLGISWNRKLGPTADLTRAKGGDASVLGLVAGVRMWF